MLPFFSLLSTSLWTASQGETIIRQMHVITRHGSRMPVGKDANNLQENTPGALTPYGELQCYTQGKWIADTYNQTGWFTYYVADQVHLESSAFDRTLVSAGAFAQGAFPHDARDPLGQAELPTGPSNVPIYSIEAENDVYFRAHDKCETFHSRLEELYQSSAWADLERTHTPLLTRLAQLDSFREQADELGKIPLANVWNVYDTLHVAMTECATSGEFFQPSCKSLENPDDRFKVNAADFEQLELLTSLVEQLRYSPERTGSLLGAPLLNRIVGRMKRNPSVGFYLYSAHYATILGIFAALDQRFPFEDTIPEYASALIFLLVHDTLSNQEYVKVVYKADSVVQTPPEVITFNFCGNETTCPLENFAGRWEGWSISEWCRECNNRNADVCLRYWLEEAEGEALGMDRPILAGLLIGFGVSLVIALLFCFFCTSTTIKWQGNNKAPEVQETAPSDRNVHRDDGMDHSENSMASVEMTDKPVMT